MSARIQLSRLSNWSKGDILGYSKTVSLFFITTSLTAHLWKNTYWQLKNQPDIASTKIFFLFYSRTCNSEIFHRILTFKGIFNILGSPKNHLLNTVWKKNPHQKKWSYLLVSVFCFHGVCFVLMVLCVCVCVVVFCWFFCGGFFFFLTKFEGLTLKLWYKTCKWKPFTNML